MCKPDPWNASSTLVAGLAVALTFDARFDRFGIANGELIAGLSQLAVPEGHGEHLFDGMDRAPILVFHGRDRRARR